MTIDLPNTIRPFHTVLDKSVPIKLWTSIEDVEDEAINQLKNMARLPFVYKHVAVMPDVHTGKGATIGSVVCTKNAIIPAAVGVDIGCGMMAVKLNIEADLLKEKSKEIRHSIERSIPVGFDRNKKLTDSVQKWEGWERFKTLYKNTNYLFNIAQYQLGSLGGGNHFIELCEDEAKNVWVMLHSGSRNIGKTLAESHIDKAKDDMKAFFIDLPDPDLAYFVTGKPEFDSYINDLHWAQEYAYFNRIEMMNRILKDMSYSIGLGGEPLDRVMEVNCHHNYVEKENHFGQNVYVTRKGAVRARENDYGIIPGSMGTRSYIVKGKGNIDSFCSCSHGAGRRMSRAQARKQFTESDLIIQTKDVNCRKDLGVLDEIPAAYKDIDQVMENQKDLVSVVAVLKQFICIKG